MKEKWKRREEMKLMLMRRLKMVWMDSRECSRLEVNFGHLVVCTVSSEGAWELVVVFVYFWASSGLCGCVFGGVSTGLCFG